MPVAVNATVGGEADHGLLARAGQADISQTALFFQGGRTAFIQRPLVREQPFFPTRQKDRVEFKSLGPVQGHQGHFFFRRRFFVLHDQRDMFQKPLKIFKVLQGAQKFLQVFQASRGFRGLAHFPHGRVT